MVDRKRFKIFTLIIIILIAFISIFITYINFDKNNSIWFQKGLYFIKSDSYLGYPPNQQPFLQLPFIYVHGDEKTKELPFFNHYYLMSDNGEIPVIFVRFNKGSDSKNYTLYTIAIKLPEMKKGQYIFKKLKLVNDNKSIVFNIGSWNIDIRDDRINTNDIKIGKKTFVSGIFDWYRAELINNTNDDIKIIDLEFNLSEGSFEKKIISGPDFDLTTFDNSLVLRAQEKRTFQFEFKELETINNGNNMRFITIRPYLIYEINNKKRYLSLPTILYSPSIDDDYVLDYIKGLK